MVPSHGASVLLLAPLALVGRRAHRAVPVHGVELVAQCLTLTTATLLTLAPGHLTLGFAPLPVLVWAAVRFSAWTVVVEQVVFAFAISLLTQLGSGPFTDLRRRCREQHPLRAALPHLRGPDRPAPGHRDAAARAGRRPAQLQRAHVPPQLHRLADPDRAARLRAGPGHGSPRPTSRPPTCWAVVPRTWPAGRWPTTWSSPEMFDALDALEARAGDDPLTGWSGPVSVIDQPRTRVEATLSLLEHEDEHGPSRCTWST